MVRELQPHLLDPLEEPPIEPTLTQRNENLRVTRSRGSNANVEDSHSAMAYLAMCDKFDDFSDFALMAIEKYDLKVSLTKEQFGSIP